MTVEMHAQKIQALALMEPDPKGAGTKNGKQTKVTPLAVGVCGAVCGGAAVQELCAWPLVNGAVVPQMCVSGLLKPGTFGIPSGTLDKFLASLNLCVEILNPRSRLCC